MMSLRSRTPNQLPVEYAITGRLHNGSATEQFHRQLPIFGSYPAVGNLPSLKGRSNLVVT